MRSSPARYGISTPQRPIELGLIRAWKGQHLLGMDPSPHGRQVRGRHRRMARSAISPVSSFAPTTSPQLQPASETLASPNSNRRADQIKSLFHQIGLATQTQAFSFLSPLSGQRIANGTNVYGILHAPRTDGSESLVLMASWLSRRPGSDAKGGDVNVRGVASVLALAKYLSS